MHCRPYPLDASSIPIPACCEGQNISLDITKHSLGSDPPPIHTQCPNALDRSSALRTMAQAEGHDVPNSHRPVARHTPHSLNSSWLAAAPQGTPQCRSQGQGDLPKGFSVYFSEHEECYSQQSHTNGYVQTAYCGFHNCCPGPHLNFFLRQESDQAKAECKNEFFFPSHIHDYESKKLKEGRTLGLDSELFLFLILSFLI